jgi:hypothetical protein
MKIIKSGKTDVIVMDEIGPGGACHIYKVKKRPEKEEALLSLPTFASVIFQNGPIKEVGVNGCQNEDLIAIVVDRLRGFQKGAFSCRENALALTKLEEALMWLNHRTKDREDRGVEGKNEA